MTHALLRTPEYIRATKRIVKSRPEVAGAITTALERLANDPHDARLHTHKLQGELQDQWSCRAGYDLRIVFRFIKHHETDAILLLTIGTHDEVY